MSSYCFNAKIERLQDSKISKKNTSPFFHWETIRQHQQDPIKDYKNTSKSE